MINRFFEINTDTDVLCYIPSGKITADGQQKTQFMQDGGTCWFYSPKRLANASGFTFVDERTRERYEIISNFRKTQSRLDSAVLLAATILAQNHPEDKIYQVIISTLLCQRGIVTAYKYSPKISQSIADYSTSSGVMLARQLKDIQKDLDLIQEFITRYKAYNTVPLINNPETLKSIQLWLKSRNPYQSELLTCACVTADRLGNLGSIEFSGQYKNWSFEPRKLIVHTSIKNSRQNAFAEDPFASILEKQKSNPIILGFGKEFESNQKELSVEQKQNLRKKALIDFNQKISRETLNLFNLQLTNFQTAEELKNQLKVNGPITIVGYYGKQYYNAPAHLLKNLDGSNQTIGSRQLFGWYSSEAKQLDIINREERHQIIIIGIKYNTAQPNKSYVLFLDSNDSSFSNEQRKVYCMSFERLCNNRSNVDQYTLNGHYSVTNNLPERVFKQEIQRLQSGKEGLLRYGLMASLGVVATAGVAYAAYNYFPR